MLSDRAPFEYLYMSRRLLTELFKHEEAARPRLPGEISFGWRGNTFKPKRRLPDFDNLSDLAMRSEKLVSDNTGDLNDPYSKYVRGEVELHRGVFSPLMGWKGGTVACFRGEIRDPGAASVFVALFGSASNLVGYRAGDDALEGFTPSDIMGLYGFLDAVREGDDPEIDLEYRTHEYAMERRVLVREGIDFARGGAQFLPQRLTFLARRLLDAEDYRSSAGDFDRVFIGAPLWVATPHPSPAERGIPG